MKERQVNMKKKTKRKNFKRFLTATLSVCMIFGTIAFPASADTTDGECKKLTVTIGGSNPLAGRYLTELQEYDEVTGKWNKISADSIESVEELEDGSYEFKYSLNENTCFRLEPGPLEMSIETTSGIAVSGPGSIISNDDASIEATVSVPDGDLWIGDGGYAIGTYTAETFKEMEQNNPEKLTDNNRAYICYDMDNRTIHEDARGNSSIYMCKDVTIAAIVVEEAKEDTTFEMKSVGDAFNVVVLSGFENGKNAIVQNLAIGIELNLSLPAVKTNNLTVYNNAKLNVDKLESLNDLYLYNNGCLSSEKEFTVSCSTVKTQYGAIVSAPGVELDVEGNIDFVSGAKSFVKSLSGKKLTVSQTSDLSTDTLGNLGDIEVVRGGNMTVSGEASISSGAVTIASSQVSAPGI